MTKSIFTNIVIATLGVSVLTSCATRKFPELLPLNQDAITSMSCKQLAAEFLTLDEFERGVDEMAVGGIVVTTIDTYNEQETHRKIRERKRLLNKSNSNKNC